MSKRIGNFEIDVWDPYPCQVELTHFRNGVGTQIRFSHKELHDLKYAVDVAFREAKAKLGKDEVE